MSVKYRKRPVVIEAVQLLWTNWSEMCEFAGVGYLADGKPEGCFIASDGHALPKGSDWRWPDEIGMRIPTLEGVMLARQGDWIVKGVHGELYPVKPDIFAETYEAVEGLDG